MDLSHIRFSGAPTIPPRRPPLEVARHVISQASATVPASPAAPVATGLAALVLERSGLDPAAYRAASLQRRVPACVRALGAGSEATALAMLCRTPTLRPEALNALLLGVTGFFRDAEVFAAIERQVLPRLRAKGRPPRVLSVGCAAGAELYSVAMLLAEAGLLDGAVLTGIDARADAIAAARRGVFAPAAVHGVSEARRRQHLIAAAGGAQVHGDLRRHATWQVADATRGLPPGSWDLVLCRNLLIYLQPDIALQLYDDLRAALAADGILVLGRAERPPRPLGLQPLGPCVHHAPGA